MAIPASRPGRQHWLTWAVLVLGAAAVWAVFGSVRGFHYVLWDDDHNIQLNSHLGGVTWDNLRWMFTDTTYSRRYFPLAWLGWNLEHDLFGLTPYTTHLGNVLFHLVNTVLVFFVTRAALRLWFAGTRAANSAVITLACWAGTLFWALHPLRVEVVAWASARIYAQSGCFLLVATWCFLRALESAPGSAASRRFRWASAAALALSLLTYPVALSFVGIFVVLDWYLPARLRPAPAAPFASRAFSVVRDNLPFIVVTAAVLAVTLWARTNVSAVGWNPPVTLAQFGVASRFMQACYVWAYFLWKPLLPFHLSPYYTRLLEFSPGDWEFVVSFLLVAATTVLLFLRRARWPGLWVLWLCHLIVLAPVLGLTEHPHFTSDRYCYLAGVVGAVGLAALLARARSWWVPAMASGVIVVFLGALTLRQVRVWKDTESLGLHMIAEMGEHPRRFDIYQRIATSLRTEGRMEESNAYYLKFLGGDPQAAEKALNHARGLEAQGQTREAFAQYLLASKLKPDLAEPPLRLGTILLADDRAAEALPYLRDAARLAPGSVDAQVTLGWAFNRCGQAPEAIPHFEAALRLQPADAAAHSGLGAALLAAGHPVEALPHLEEVVRLYPNSPLAHFQLGQALLDGLARNADAATQFEITLRLQPDFPGAREALERARR
jgi:Flp pilus assembly protein TadD